MALAQACQPRRQHASARERVGATVRKGERAWVGGASLPVTFLLADLEAREHTHPA